MWLKEYVEPSVVYAPCIRFVSVYYSYSVLRALLIDFVRHIFEPAVISLFETHLSSSLRFLRPEHSTVVYVYGTKEHIVVVYINLFVSVNTADFPTHFFAEASAPVVTI